MLTNLTVPLSFVLLAAGATSPARGNCRLADAVVGNWAGSLVVCRPVSLRDVELGGFLGKHLRANDRSLLAGLESPIPRAFDAWARGEPAPKECARLATDSDFYKWLEGACYALAANPDQRELAAAVDHYAQILVRMQEPDGYLGTRISPAVPFDRKVRHDLYVAGHFIEAAVAHHAATGHRELLDAAMRLADYYRRAHAEENPYFQIVGTGEHPEIEIALVRLARATSEKRLLDFASAILGMSRIAPTLAETHAGGGKLHAVRLCYLLSGAVEMDLQSSDHRHLSDVQQLWDEIVSTRMYITGGIGASERLPEKPYDLPQSLEGNANRDIAETCASVAMMMLSWRLHAETGESKYFDTIETILYNHYLGALSPDHLGIFYYNPLRRVGDLTGKTDHGSSPVERRRLPEIHSTACCMPNAWRFFGQLPEYVFSRRGDALIVNLYTTAAARHCTSDGTSVRVLVETAYPHDGRVRIRVLPEKKTEFPLQLRIPAWCTRASLRVGSEALPAPRPGSTCTVDHTWPEEGEDVELLLDMPPVVIRPRPEVAANANQIAFRRGPVVYCLEQQDLKGIELSGVTVTEPDRAAEQIAVSIDARLAVPVLHVELSGDCGARTGQMIPFYLRATRDSDPRWLTWIPVLDKSSPGPGAAENAAPDVH